MGRSLIKRGYVATGALSLIVMALLSSKCSGNPVEITYPSLPAPGHMIEIVGMGASYKEGQGDRNLAFIVNEYEYDKSNSVLGHMRLGYARLGYGGRHIVRQSVCYDSNVPIPKEFNVVVTKHCKERAADQIIEAEQYTTAMIKEVVRERDLHARPTFEYRYTEGEDLLDFDLQLRPYYVENQWSENVTVRRSDWDCTEQTSGRSECLWQPENLRKRVVNGMS